MARIPVGFISHGAPTLALEVGGFAAALEAWGTRLRAAAPPRGVAIVSAHWVSAIPRTGLEARGPLFYDFGGFDPALREVQYPAPGSPALAAQVRELTGAKAEPTRALDHGVWVPLLKMFPAADLPVVLKRTSAASAATLAPRIPTPDPLSDIQHVKHSRQQQAPRGQRLALRE